MTPEPRSTGDEHPDLHARPRRTYAAAMTSSVNTHLPQCTNSECICCTPIYAQRPGQHLALGGLNECSLNTLLNYLECSGQVFLSGPQVLHLQSEGVRLNYP